jgi:hypothetical protein
MEAKNLRSFKVLLSPGWISTKPGQVIQEEITAKMDAHQERMEASMDARVEGMKDC